MDQSETDSQGKRLRELRGRQTKAAVARAIGVSDRRYAEWEKGANIAPQNVLRLAEHFHVDADYIEFGTGRPAQPPQIDPAESDGDLMDELEDHRQRLERIEQLVGELATDREVITRFEALLQRLASRIEQAPPQSPAGTENPSADGPESR